MLAKHTCSAEMEPNTYREDGERLRLALATRLGQRDGSSGIVEGGFDTQRGLAKQLEGVPVNVGAAELLGHSLGYLLAKQREPGVGLGSRRRGRGRHGGQAGSDGAVGAIDHGARW